MVLSQYYVTLFTWYLVRVPWYQFLVQQPTVMHHKNDGLWYYLGHPAICGLGVSPGNGGCKRNLHNNFSMQLVIERNSGVLT